MHICVTRARADVDKDKRTSVTDICITICKYNPIYYTCAGALYALLLVRGMFLKNAVSGGH